jgi:ribose 1,5-bisphosphate isomerase
MSFEKTLLDIKNLRIQGAESIAREAVKSLKEIIHKSKTADHHKLLAQLNNAKTKLVNSRPTEPCMRNSLEYVFRQSHGESIRELRESFILNIQYVLRHLGSVENKIADIGSQKIKNGMIVFTHCHSSTVISILKLAKSLGKKFEVHNTETRPLFQGRVTAQELSKAGIKITHYIDSAARLALKKSDIMLIGCDAITSEGKVINKIGSELFAEIANNYDVPIYVCTNSWKFDPATVFGFEETIEKRSSIEIWKDKPKNVKIDNHIFEIVKPSLITGVISELGIFKPTILIEEIKKRYPWLV